MVVSILLQDEKDLRLEPLNFWYTKKVDEV